MCPRGYGSFGFVFADPSDTVDVACFKFQNQEHERESEGKTDFIRPLSQPFQGDNRFDLTLEIWFFSPSFLLQSCKSGWSTYNAKHTLKDVWNTQRLSLAEDSLRKKRLQQVRQENSSNFEPRMGLKVFEPRSKCALKITGPKFQSCLFLFFEFEREMELSLDEFSSLTSYD